jgi:hypothetical protein
MKGNIKQVQRNEHGMAPLIVTFVLIIVISIIVVGFSQITRINSREALDRQLSTQAYYAAETGVNFAKVKLASGYSPTSDDATSCTSFTDSTNLNTVLSATENVKITCMLVNSSISPIVSTVGQDSSEVYEFQPTASTPDLTFSWDSSETLPDNPTCPTAFPSTQNWALACPFGVLRVDLSLGAAGANTPDSLNAVSSSLYIKPSQSGGTITAENGSPVIGNAQCTTTQCVATVDLPDGAAFTAGTDYFMRLSSIYENAGQVVIRPSNTATEFNKAEALIDVTAVAQDELRRLQVYVPFVPEDSDLANNAVSSAGSICKNFSILGPGDTASPSDFATASNCGN